MAATDSIEIRRHCTGSVAALQDLEACRFAVYVSGGVDYPADGGRAAGILQEGGKTGEAVSFAPQNAIHPVLASAAIPEGVEIASTADGRAKVAGVGEQVLGFSVRGAAAAGDYVSVFMQASGEL